MRLPPFPVKCFLILLIAICEVILSAHAIRGGKTITITSDMPGHYR